METPEISDAARHQLKLLSGDNLIREIRIDDGEPSYYEHCRSDQMHGTVRAGIPAKVFQELHDGGYIVEVSAIPSMTTGTHEGADGQVTEYLFMMNTLYDLTPTGRAASKADLSAN